MTARETAALRRKVAVCRHGQLKRQCVLCEADDNVKRLVRKIKTLERDRMFARSLLLPGQVAIYKLAMRLYLADAPDTWKACLNNLYLACARARKGTK